MTYTKVDISDLDLLNGKSCTISSVITDAEENNVTKYFFSSTKYENETVSGLALFDRDELVNDKILPIKTINGESIIGDGDIHIEGGEVDPEQIYSIIEQAMKPLSEQVQKLTVCLDYVSQAHDIQFSDLNVYDPEEEQNLRFTIEKDMTWREFIESSFNTEGWTLDGSNYVFIRKEGFKNYYIMESGHVGFNQGDIISDPIPVLADDVIIDSGAYVIDYIEEI